MILATCVMGIHRITWCDDDMFQRPGPYVEVHHGGGHPWFGFLLLVLLAAGVTLAALTLWRAYRPGATVVTAAPPSAPPRDPALAELRLRYARGEIDRDEYLQRATDLGDLVPLPHQQAAGDT